MSSPPITGVGNSKILSSPTIFLADPKKNLLNSLSFITAGYLKSYSIS